MDATNSAQANEPEVCADFSHLGSLPLSSQDRAGLARRHRLERSKHRKIVDGKLCGKKAITSCMGCSVLSVLSVCDARAKSG